MSKLNPYQQFLLQNNYPRQLRNLTWQKTNLYCGDKKLIDFTSNDYLGLSQHPLLIARSQDFSARYGTGSSSSRLVRGNHEIYTELEQQIAHALKKESALILASGYQTNIAVLEALLNSAVLGVKPLVFCDKYAHTSMQIAAYQNAELFRFKHNDLNHLTSLLQKYQHRTEPKFILVETLYSMDGDQVNLAELTELAERHHAFLYVDDAHAFGIYGKTGWGMAEDYAEKIDLVMGTFSKAMGCFGGYVACSKLLRDYLVNKCRGLIYSTALPPPVLGAISAAVELIPTLTEERSDLWQNTQQLHQILRHFDLDTGQSRSYIIPWVIRDAEKTRAMSEYLLDQGIFASAIQPPTVPKHQSRIRLCSNAKHSAAEMAHLEDALKNL